MNRSVANRGKVWLGVAMCGLLTGGCAHRLQESTWTLLEAGRYRFSDRDFLVECRTGERHISWTFKNHAFVPLTIDHGEIALKMEGDSTDYTLWGSRREQSTHMPPIEIKPQGFVRFDYPIRFDSPLFPARHWAEKGVYLELMVRWGKSPVPYRIRFFADGESEGNASRRKTGK